MPRREAGLKFNFSFCLQRRGFLRFFAQTQVDGQRRFAPFTVRVRP